MKTIIENGTIVNEGNKFKGSVVIDKDRIEEVIAGNNTPRGNYDNRIDATGCLVLPGIIDEHVHFREPGMTRKADIESESRAAACGGVTTYFEMPNTNPQTVTLEAWEDKMRRAEKESYVNYAFFYGATNDNVSTFKDLDPKTFPGIKLFMGASTGNMLVDRREALEKIFQECARLDLPLMTHCEDTGVITQNLHNIQEQLKMQNGPWEDPPVGFHPLIRSEKACFNSSSLAVELAQKFGTRLHIAHVSTAKELELFDAYRDKDINGLSPLPQITGEIVMAHLLFSDKDYETKGTLIKCNPAVKTMYDREVLRTALIDGRILCVATDHAPHELSDKQGGCVKATSGMPMVQFSLVSMLQLVEEGVLPIERLVWLMCHNPARLFSVSERGFLRKGYKADITIVRRGAPWTLTDDIIQSKCKWSPLIGAQFRWRVERTICNGHTVYDASLNNKEERIKNKSYGGYAFDGKYRGEAVHFER